MLLVMAKQTSSPETIHQRITQLRKEYGYTQGEIAEMLDVPQSVVSLYESGGRRFHAEIIAKFVETFGVSADELLGIKSANSNGQKVGIHLTKRMQRIQQLPKTRQKALLQTIDLFLKGAEK
jgi:transcriptional regulator with XRE-family HTH domain